MGGPALAHRSCAFQGCGVGIGRARLLEREFGGFCGGGSRTHACGGPGAALARQNVDRALFGTRDRFIFL